MDSISRLRRRIVAIARSTRGHNALVFAAFLALSTMLWFVTVLNDDTTADVRLPVAITHVPDSVTLISEQPRSLSVSVRARGTQLLRLNLGHNPSVNIDFRQYQQGSFLRLSDPDLKALARQSLDGADITFIAPDSLALAFTSRPPVILPVTPDYTATAGPQATIVGRPRLSVDSVQVYSVSRLPQGTEAVTTEPLRLAGINETTTRRVRLIAPPRTRVIPDSVDITIAVEPLIFKTRKVHIQPIHVPEGIRLITFPSHVDVMYMIPLSDYKTTEPAIKVVADYNTLHGSNQRMMRIKISQASDNLRNVHLAVDSVEYIIEHL